MNGTLWGLAGPIRWNVLGSVIVCLLVTACYVAQGMLMALTLGAVFHTHDAVRGEWCLAGLLAALLARGALLWLAEAAAQKTAQSPRKACASACSPSSSSSAELCQFGIAAARRFELKAAGAGHR
jgi:ATP-binding cassette subfamily C protein CydD